MLFNSLEFALFFVIVYSLYLILKHKWQNRMLLVASYVFYGAWDWRFLSLIFISTLLDYICGLKINGSEDEKKRKLFLFISIFGNLSILGFFKYFNFFAGSLDHLLTQFGFSVQSNFMDIVLPIGISFYTFQTMSYTIDIYRKELEPTKRFFDYALYVAFFPQLVAGPIERASHLLPQILTPRKFRLDWLYEGSYLIFLGLYQKMFIADNLSKIVDPVFAGPPYDGFMVLIGLYAFAFQILCDFAGYSNIARGLGRLMGFDIMVNFRLPYFSTNPREFWQRWHISLSTWLRDYLYIPLGGNKNGILMTFRNLSAIMLLGGLWHGASWTFILWGGYHGILLILHRSIELLSAKLRFPSSFSTNRIWFIAKIIFFFHITCLGWLLFRASSLDQAISMLSALTTDLQFTTMHVSIFINFLFFIGVLFVLQVVEYIKNIQFAVLGFNPVIQVLLYMTLLYSLLLLGVTTHEDFIYFQF